jgi:hypothetical protein
MPYTPETLSFQTLTVPLPPIAPNSSVDVTVVWNGPIPGEHYQVGLAIDGIGSNCVVKAQSRTAALVTVSADAKPIRMGTPLTAAVLYY